MPRLIRTTAAGLLLTAFYTAACGGAGDGSSPVRVAAAADLTDAFAEIGRAFTSATGHDVTFSFGATGILAQQVRGGAPFDVFAAANVTFVNTVIVAGVCDGATKTHHARGRIAVWTRRGGVAPPSQITDLAKARFARVAIANPDHAPYGMAAKQALETAGVWTTLQPRLVFAENVRQTLQFAETGNVDAAIVALALVARDTINPWMLVPDSLHRPIDQALVVCNGGANRDGALAFADFVNSSAGRSIMRRYGFLLPGESPE